MKLFKKILIANRGEIAVRVIRSARKLGIRTVAIYSNADSGGLHVKMADEAYSLGSDELHESYLDIPKIIGIAQHSGSEAIHPGYGFLSENPSFVKACDEAGIVFIGPHAEAIRLMGNKIESRAFVKKVGIPMTEGITGDIDTLEKRAREIPFPILVKAAAGGGGKGMRIVYEEKDLREILESTTREAKSYFGDGTVFIEKFIEDPRHIEIQVLGDNHGNAIHLFERECSIQRRYQKIIEESPSPTLNQEVRLKMGEAAANIARQIKYNNAGTVEFLVDKDLNYYFLEMNTRVQVEHPVTEIVTGIDIVKEQILIAAGKELDIEQGEVTQNGHAIECRIYAEDPENNFMPSPGLMTLYQEPSGENIRLDTGIEKAGRIESFYDPMISKLIVWGDSREIAREKMISALNNYVIHGIKTNIPYLREMLQHKAYIENTISTKYCDEHTDSLVQNIHDEKSEIPVYLPVIAAYLYDFNKWKIDEQNELPGVWKMISYWREVMELSIAVDGEKLDLEIEKIKGNHYVFRIGQQELEAGLKLIRPGEVSFTVGNHQYDFNVSHDGRGTIFAGSGVFIFELERDDVLVTHEEILGSFDATSGENDIRSPMPGKVIKVNVKEGDKVTKGQTLIIVEAMKMENYLAAPFDAVIGRVNVKKDDKVDGNVSLIELKIAE
jgi:acetyl-CoA carboxylase biotin carboxylase subunit